MSTFAEVLKLVCKIPGGNLKPNGYLKAEMGDSEYENIEHKIGLECNKICRGFLPTPEIILTKKESINIYSMFQQYLDVKDHIKLSRDNFISDNISHFIEQVGNKLDKLPISDSIMTTLYGEENDRFHKAFDMWMHEIVLPSSEFDIKPNATSSMDNYIDTLMASTSYKIYLHQRHASNLRDQVFKDATAIQEKDKNLLTNNHNLLLRSSLVAIKNLLVCQLEQYFNSKLTQEEVDKLKNVLNGAKNSDIDGSKTLKKRISEIFYSFFKDDSTKGPSYTNFELETKLLISEGVIKFWHNVIHGLKIKNIDLNLNQDDISSEFKERLKVSIDNPQSSYLKIYKEAFFRCFYDSDLLSLKKLFFNCIFSQFRKLIKESAQTQLAKKIGDEVVNRISPECLTQLLSSLEDKFLYALNKSIQCDINIHSIIGELEEKTYSDFQIKVQSRLSNDMSKIDWIYRALPQALDSVAASSNYSIYSSLNVLDKPKFCALYRELLRNLYTDSPHTTSFHTLANTCLDFLNLEAEELNDFDWLFSNELRDSTVVDACIALLTDDNYHDFKEILKAFLKEKFSESKRSDLLKKCSDRLCADKFNEANFNKILKALNSNSTKDNEGTAWWKWMLGGILVILVASGSIYFLNKYKLKDQ